MTIRRRPAPIAQWRGLRLAVRGRATVLLAVMLVWIAVAVAGAGVAWAGGASAEERSPGTVIHLLRNDEGGAIPLVSGLGERQVVVVRAAGFSVDRTGGVRLCEVAEPNRCGPTFPVRFDDAGAAVVQYQLDPAGDAADCATASRCVLELFDGVGSGFADLWFGTTEPVDVRVQLPEGPHLVVDQPFEVVVQGTLPADPLRVVLCGRADPFPRSCSEVPATDPFTPPSPATTTATPTTRRSTVQRFVVTPTAESMRRCEDGCALSVRAGSNALRAEVIEVSGGVERPTRYSTSRLGVGLTVATLMVVLGAWLWRRTDWSPPRSADGAAIDEAHFADLDAEVEASAITSTGPPIEVRASRRHPRP